jgi:hypothetical protein
MVLPGGVAVAGGTPGRDSVLVADFWSLREFNGLTGREEKATNYLIGFSDIQPVLTVWSDSNSLVFSSSFTNTVQVLDMKSRKVVKSYSDLAVPLNAILFQGDVVAAQMGTGSVVRLSDGKSLALGLAVPTGLAATEDDLWVGDWGTGIVWQIVADGQFLQGPNQVAANLDHPEGLAVENNKSLLVVEAGAGRLSRIDLATGEVSCVADNLKLGAQAAPGTPPIGAFNGVAVGPSGTIYVTGDIDNLLYRFNPRFSLYSQGQKMEETGGK